jgi:hypothetical protein
MRLAAIILLLLPVADGVSLCQGADRRSIADLVRDLDATQWKVREEAQAELTIHDEATLPVIETLLRDGKLSAEQRRRLDIIGLQIFSDLGIHGALGVQFAPTQEEGKGVAIAGTIDGFDSRRVLQAGDVVTGVEGIAVDSQADARSAIISCDAGQLVSVDILRDGQPRTVELRLGSYRDLNSGRRGGAAMLTGDVLAMAWDVRMRRRGDNRPTIGPGIEAERWRNASRRDGLPSADEKARRALIRFNTPVRIGDGNGVADEQSAEGTNGQRMIAGGALRGVETGASTPFSLQPVRDQRNIRTLQDQLRHWESSEESIRQQLRIPNLDEATRQQLRSSLAQAQIAAKTTREELRRQLNAESDDR